MLLAERLKLGLLILLYSLVLHAEDPVPTAHIQEFFKIPGDSRIFCRHTIIPVEQEADASIESPYFLHSNAGQIWDEAEAEGWLQGPSRSAYTKELNEYKRGRWPCTFITEAGSWTMLMHLTYAQRWEEDEPLPWESRFLGDIDGHLPERIEFATKQGVGGFKFPYFQTIPEFESETNQHLLLGLAAGRPETIGERTELKFLTGTEPSLVFFRELLHATSKYQLHRYSYRRHTKEDKDKIRAWNERMPLNERMLRFNGRVAGYKDGKRFEDFIVDHLRDPELQPFVATSGIYTHISDTARGIDNHNTRFLVLQKHLKLPDPLYSFLEGPGIGVEGIRTDIPAATINTFEYRILTSLDNHRSTINFPATYLSAEEAPSTPFRCHLYISPIERAYLNYKR